MSNKTGFRLHRLKISGHKVLKSIDIKLCDDELAPVVYTTGIIGSNGTGKSHLLGAIAAVFIEINNAKTTGNPPRSSFSFEIDYCINGNEYHVTNIKKLNIEGSYYADILNDIFYFDVTATKNGIQINAKDIELPERVIASTMTVTDKYIARSDSFYRYKGIRNERSASTTGTRTIIRKTVDSLMDCMYEKSSFQRELSSLLDYLGLEKHLHVSYGMRYKDIFLRTNMNAERLIEIFDNWKSYFPDRKYAPWGYGNFIRGLRDNKEALDAAAKFLVVKAHERLDGKSIIATYDVLMNPEEFYHDSKALKVLSQLDLVSFPSINVFKKGSMYGLENSSSGETHLLCQFIGIMADIRHNSLILIDEPENSSHPDWQMNYVGWIKEIFNEYNDCHFMIATHSPLVLMNLKASESTIIRLKRDEKNKIYDEGGMEGGCYSWTVDEVLHNVMMMKKENTDDYLNAITAFEGAIKNNDKKTADKTYYLLQKMINPKNSLLELLKIQKAIIDDDKN